MQEPKKEWKEIQEGEFYEFSEEGNSIEGTFIAMDLNVGKNNSKVFSIKTSDGKIKKVWGSKILDSRMTQVSFGQEVKIVFEGTQQPETPTGRPYHLFKVFTK